MSLKVSLILFLTSTLLVGCSTKDIDPSTESTEKNTSYVSTSSNVSLPTINIDKTQTHSVSHIPLGNVICFGNNESNQKLSIVDTKSINTKISNIDIIDYFDFSIESIVIIEDTLYFNNTADNNYIYKLNYEKDTSEKISNISAYNISSEGKNLYFIDLSSKNLYQLNTNTNKTTSLTSNKVGKYILNGEYIFYQNLSDNNTLYGLNISSKNNFKITDFPVDSFTTHNSTLLCINSIDNNSLYAINTSTYKSTKVAQINGKSLKSNGSDLYFINKSDNDYLYSLNINDDKYIEAPFLTESINNYDITKSGLFYHRKVDVNTSYFYKTN